MSSNDQQTIEQLRKELNRLKRDYARLESDHRASLARIESDRRKVESDRRKLVGDLEDAQADQDSLQEKYQSLSKELTDANQEISNLKSNLDALRLAASAVAGPSDLTKPLQTVTRQRDAALVEFDSLKIQLNEQLSEIQAPKKLTESHAELEARYKDANNEIDQLRKLVSRMDLQAREPPRTPTEGIPAVPPFRQETALRSEVERILQAAADTCKQGDAQPKAKSCVKGQPPAEPNVEGERLKKTPFQDQRPASQTSVKPKGKDPETRQIKPKAPELKPDAVQKPPAVKQAYMEDLPSRSAGPLMSSTYATAAQPKHRDAHSVFEDIKKARAMAPPKTGLGLFSKSLQSSIQPLLPDLDGLPNPITTAVKGLGLSSSNALQTAGAQQVGKAPVWLGSLSNIRDELPLGTESQELTPRTELRPTGVPQVCSGRSSIPPGFEQTHSIKALAMKDDESKGKKRFIMESDTSDTDMSSSKIPRLNIRPPRSPRN
ncbi:MAG: hypothetical protein LQ341_006264 [Variospora aurantia]|nr:MAG: hypothetical protein LQ341_006264 [Variospora aurantia]